MGVRDGRLAGARVATVDAPTRQARSPALTLSASAVTNRNSGSSRARWNLGGTLCSEAGVVRSGCVQHVVARQSVCARGDPGSTWPGKSALGDCFRSRLATEELGSRRWYQRQLPNEHSTPLASAPTSTRVPEGLSIVEGRNCYIPHTPVNQTPLRSKLGRTRRG